MKLNTTYTLHEMLVATSKSSDNLKKICEEMKQSETHIHSYRVFETEGMLSTSEFARVTLTRKSSTVPNRWEGYMEESAYRDGRKTPVAVQLVEHTIRANDDFTNFEILMNI